MIYVFPNMEIFYIWTLGWIVIFIFWTWGWTLNWFKKGILASWLGIPVGILIWSDHLKWWEALVPIFLAIVSSNFFVFRFKEDICPILPNILSEPLIVWFGYKDLNGFLNTKQREELEELVQLKNTEWHGQRSRRCCGLRSGHYPWS